MHELVLFDDIDDDRIKKCYQALADGIAILEKYILKY